MQDCRLRSAGCAISQRRAQAHPQRRKAFHFSQDGGGLEASTKTAARWRTDPLFRGPKNEILQGIFTAALERLKAYFGSGDYAVLRFTLQKAMV
jgi:hypothetical protein